MEKGGRGVLLLAILIAGLILLLCLLAFFALAPVFCTAVFAILYVIWLFITTEDSVLHGAQEHENRFWTLMSFVFATALFFIYDSPFAIGLWSPRMGFLAIALFTFAIHSYDRQLHRKRTGRAPPFPASIKSSALLNTDVQAKCARILECLTKIDHTLVATNIAHFINADKVLRLEEEIISLIGDTDPSELNYMLPKIKMGLLFYKVKDHPSFPHRTQLLEMLTVSRVADLNVTSRALVLDALQQMKLSAHRKSEYYACNVILKTTGDDLSLLKSLTDSKGDFHSLHKLVYQDIKNEAIRRQVLAHIAKQANVQAAHMRLRTRASKIRTGFAWRKILSDVDDTLTCSGGRYPAGVDARLPRKSLYPGVLDFYRELDLGTEGPDEWQEGRVGNLVFISARPHVYKDVSEAQSYAKFSKLQKERGLYTSPTLLAGSMDTGTAFVLRGDMEPLARKKYQNFEEFRSLYPEFKHVFVGDNGQGDVRAAELMIQNFPDSVEMVFVHQVQAANRTYGYTGPGTLARWQRMGIIFVGNYVDAAIHAYTWRLIRARGLYKVCLAVSPDFRRIPWERPLSCEALRQSLNRSLERANTLLCSSGLPAVPPIQAVQAFEMGAEVLTPFGRGVVRAFRPDDGVYEVHIRWNTGSIAPVSGYASSISFLSRKPYATASSAPAGAAAVHAAASAQLLPAGAPAAAAAAPPPAAADAPVKPPAQEVGRTGSAEVSADQAQDTTATASPMPDASAVPSPQASAMHAAAEVRPAAARAPASSAAAAAAAEASADAASPPAPLETRRASGPALPFEKAIETVGWLKDAGEGPPPPPAGNPLLHDGGGGEASDASASEAPGAWNNSSAAWQHSSYAPDDDSLASTDTAAGSGVGDSAPRPQWVTLGTPRVSFAQHARPPSPHGGSGASSVAVEDSGRFSGAWDGRLGPPPPQQQQQQPPPVHSFGAQFLQQQQLQQEQQQQQQRLDEQQGTGHHHRVLSASGRPPLYNRTPCQDLAPSPKHPASAPATPRGRARGGAETPDPLLLPSMPAVSEAPSKPEFVVKAYLQLASLTRAPPLPEKRHPPPSAHAGTAASAGGASSGVSGALFALLGAGGSAEKDRPAKPLAKGATAVSAMGPVVVRRFREADGVYEVELPKWILSTGKPARAYMPQSALSIARSNISSSAGGGSPGLFGKAGLFSSLFHLSSSNAAPPAAAAAVAAATTNIKEIGEGERVLTPFGKAVVLGVRRPRPSSSSPAKQQRSGSSAAAGVLDSEELPSALLAADTAAAAVAESAASESSESRPASKERELLRNGGGGGGSAASNNYNYGSGGSSSSRGGTPRNSFGSSGGGGGGVRRPRAESAAGAGELSNVASSPGRLTKSVSLSAPASAAQSPDKERRADGAASNMSNMTALELYGDASCLFEVELLDWRLANGRCARATLNRASLWREGEKRPAGSGGVRRPLDGGASSGGSGSGGATSTSAIMGFISRFSLSSTSKRKSAGGVSGSVTSAGTPAGTAAASGAAAAAKPAVTGGSGSGGSSAADAPAPAAAAMEAAAASCTYPPGSLVESTWGPAVVAKCRVNTDGVTELALLHWRMADGRCARAFVPVEGAGSAIRRIVARPGEAVVTRLGLGRVTAASHEDGKVLVVMNDTEVQVLPADILGAAKAVVGEAVMTTLGPGRVVGYRVSTESPKQAASSGTTGKSPSEPAEKSGQALPGGEAATPSHAGAEAMAAAALAGDSGLADETASGGGAGLNGKALPADTYVVRLQWGLLYSPGGNAILSKVDAKAPAALAAGREPSRAAGTVLHFFSRLSFGAAGS